MTVKEVFAFLDGEETLENKKQTLREFLQKQVEVGAEDESSREHLAYDVAGLLATKLAVDLPEDDPYLEILDMASELELPEVHRADGLSWQSFSEKVNKLQ